MGFDTRRMTILLALLERHGGMQLGGYDVFLSVAGGLKLDDPGGELAAALAVATSLRDRALAPGTFAVGELGLGAILFR
jgi:DNA repair protein RadA/Sms